MIYLIDLDDTLITTSLYHDEMVKDFCDEGGIILDDYNYLWKYLEGLPQDEKEYYYKLCDRTRAFYYAKLIPAMPNIQGFLDYAKRNGHELYVFTDSPVAHAEMVLSRLGLRDYFKDIFSSSLTDKMLPPKDDETSFFKIAKSLNCKPSDMVLIDNDPGFCATAKRAGVTAIGVKDSWHKAEEMTESCDIYLDTIDSILGFKGACL